MKRKQELKILLDKEIKKCRRCSGMNIRGLTENAPGYGNIDSPVMMIGQSLCTECMITQIPFTGGSGLILDIIFGQCQVAKEDLFITNLVHCHPVNNRPSKPEEIRRCLPYLESEIALVNPLLIVGLGADVRNTLFPVIPYNYNFKHINGKYEGRNILCVYHPAYYWRWFNRNLEHPKVKEYIEFLTYQMRRWL